jgi:hypothetical protein
MSECSTPPIDIHMWHDCAEIKTLMTGRRGSREIMYRAQLSRNRIVAMYMQAKVVGSVLSAASLAVRLKDLDSQWIDV